MKIRNKQPKPIANQQLIKESNLKHILRLINKFKQISRAELANKTGLSPTTVSSLTDELINNGYVIETGLGETTTSGRKPILLEINSRGGFVASFELVIDGFNFALYDLKCNEIFTNNYTVADYNSIGEDMIITIEDFLKDRDINETKLLGIFIGVPGLIDAVSKRVISSTVVPIDENNDFYDKLKARFEDALVYIGNQSCFYAYAENTFGVDKRVDNLVFIDINVGIGAGIIINKHIFTGSFGFAGEIGHMAIDINGPKCKCGNQGCLEVMANVPSMIQKVIFSIMSGQKTIIQDKIGSEYHKITIDLLKRAADEGDELVLQVIKETAYKLAVGLNNIINLFNPEIIIIGGEIVKLGDFLLDEIKEQLRSKVFDRNTDNINIEFSKLGKNAVTLGGARYILDKFFY